MPMCGAVEIQLSAEDHLYRYSRLTFSAQEIDQSEIITVGISCEAKANPKTQKRASHGAPIEEK